MPWHDAINPFAPFKKSSVTNWGGQENEEFIKNGKNIMKAHYMQFEGSQFFEHKLPQQKDHLLFRILYALYGPPQENGTQGAVDNSSKNYKDYSADCDVGYHFTYSKCDNTEDSFEESSQTESHTDCDTIMEEDGNLELPKEFLSAYDATQKKEAFLIFNKLIQQSQIDYDGRTDLKPNDYPNKPLVAHVGVVFIFCKDENQNEFSTPIFSVLQKNQNIFSPQAERSFIDPTGRVYRSWNDWMKNNTLPKVKYIIPTNGFYTNGRGFQYEYDPSKELDLLFSNSPACSPSAKVVRSLDAVSTVGLLACGVISVASAGFPLMVLWAGTGFGVYGAGRSAHRIRDKKNHKEKMADLETTMLVLNIAAAPLSVISTPVNMGLIKAAQAETQMVSRSYQIFTTVLNCTNRTMNGAFFCFGLSSFVQKLQKDQLSPLDLLHFSMSTYFFLNNVMKPVTAKKIIIKAQDECITQMAKNVDNKDGFGNYLRNNRYNKSLEDNARIIKSLKGIQNPNAVFSKVSSDVVKIKISGKKAQNLILIKDNKTLQKLNPRTIANEQASSSKRNLEYTPIYESTKKKNISKLIDIQDVPAFSKLLFDAAMGNKNIIKISEEIIRIFKINKTNASIIKVIAFVINECKKKCQSSALVGAQNVADNLPTLERTITEKLKSAKRVADRNCLNFHDDFQLFIFYNKYGIDFPYKLQTQEISLHIEHSPEHLKGMLVENSTFKLETDDGIERSYELTRNGKLTVTMNNFFHGCSIDVKTGAIRSVREQLKDFINSDDIRELVEGIPFHVFHAQGFTTSNERFYSNVPIRVFLQGDLDGIPFNDLLHK